MTDRRIVARLLRPYHLGGVRTAGSERENVAGLLSLGRTHIDCLSLLQLVLESFDYD